MSKVTVNTLQELQTEIGSLIRIERRQSFEERFGINLTERVDSIDRLKVAIRGLREPRRQISKGRDGLRAVVANRDDRVRDAYEEYVTNCGEDEPLEQWEWELLGYAAGIE